MIMEADKSHNVLSASWRPRKAAGIVQSKSKGLRTRGIDYAILTEAGKDPCLGLSSHLDDAHLHWRRQSALLSQMLIPSKTPSQTHPEIMV